MPVSDTHTVKPVAQFDLVIDDLPGSKSLTNRALLLAALADGETTLGNVLFADDSRVMLNALESLGFPLQIDEPNRQVKIEGSAGVITGNQADLFLGNAGTATRFLTAACCLGKGQYRIDGIERMRERPISELVQPLRKLGATITYELNEGYPPLIIDANGLAGGEVIMPPTLSSQFISALLQIAPCMSRGLTMKFAGDVISRPYIEMTLELMKRFGAKIEVDSEFTEIHVAGGTSYKPYDWVIEPDASNASYFFAAAAVRPGSRCQINHLGNNSLQGDAQFAQVLARMGAGVTYTDQSITVTGPDQLKAIDINLNAMPDMAQTLAVIALFAQGSTVIRDIGNLRVKETDRMEALRIELTKLGASIRVEGDDLHIHPPADGQLAPAAIDTYDDHRMAMSFAIAGLVFNGVTINDPDCVNKTFPEYFDFLNRLYPTNDGGA